MSKTSPFPHLYERLALVERLKDPAVDAWLAHPVMHAVFQKYNMEPPYFREHYAENVFNYFVGVVKEENVLGECPVISKMIDYFKNRDMTAEDLFGVCSVFRQTLIRTLCAGGLHTPDLIDEVQTIADKNFTSVITYFNQTVFSNQGPIEEQLQLLKEYQKILDRGAVVSKTDTDGIITYVNNAFCALSGYSKEELLGQRHNIVRHPDMDERFFETMWQTIKAKKTFNGIMKNRNKAGGSFYVHTTIIPILNRDNDIIEYIAMRQDVTKLIAALEAAKQARKVKDEFLANISHEIRTPLNGILGFVQSLKKSIIEPKHVRKLDVIEQSSQSLMGIINDILDYSKIESGKFGIDPHEFNMHKEFMYLIELFTPKAEEKTMTLLSSMEPSVPMNLVADSGRIRQILINLISNAIKFTPRGGRIKFEVLYRHTVHSLVLRVKDNGIGIQKHKLKSIFNAFEQADGSISRQYGGTGLGLAITKKLVGLLNGTINVQSEIGRGTAFEVVLPVDTLRISKETQMDSDTKVASDAVVLKEEMPAYTIKQIAAEVGIKEKSVALLLQVFLEESFSTLSQLSEAISLREYEQICQYAHSLKGSAGNLRLHAIESPARAMERASKQGETEFDYSENLQKISEALERVKAIPLP